MKRVLIPLSAVVVFMLAAMLLMGCTSRSGRAENRVEEAYEAQGLSLGMKGAQHKEQIRPPAEGEQPSSHEMMAMMILQREGRSTDLSSYDRVDLVELELADGSTVMAVVLDGDGEVIFSQTAGQTE